jgi:hypothetical protein
MDLWEDDGILMKQLVEQQLIILEIALLVF